MTATRSTQHPTDSTSTAAKAIRAQLHETFPGAKFTVRAGRGITVTWTDGPTSDAVQDVTQAFILEQGIIAHTRKHSDDTEAWAREQIILHPGRWGNDFAHGGSDYYVTRRCLAESAF